MTTVEPITTHVADALSRLLEQYKDAARLRGIITAIAGPVQTIEDAITALALARSIDDAEGAHLDRLGEIVGYLRPPLLSDEAYRIFIVAKIGVNASQGETERVIEIYKLITQAQTVRLSEYFPAAVELFSDGSIPAGMSATVLQFMNDVVPAGVSVNNLSIGAYYGANSFTIGPSETGGGFGDLNDPEAGGGFGALVIA